jgi:hypothetical protein
MEKIYNKYTNRDWSNAFEVFKSTGEIQDALLVYFDQHGKWVDFPHSTVCFDESLLAQQTIPPDRLVRTCEDGRKILLSSFRESSEEPIEIDYYHVIGGVDILSTKEFRAPNLVNVDGGMWIESAKVIHLPNLENVNYQFDAESVTILNLPNLKRIDGYLTVNGADIVYVPNLDAVMRELEAVCAVTFHAPCLRRVGALNLDTAAIIYLPNLKTSGPIEAENATMFDAPKLEIVYGQIDAMNTIFFHAPLLQRVLESLNAGFAVSFHASNLKTVKENLDAGSAVIFDALKLEEVGGELTLPLETLNAAVRAGCKAAIAEAAGGI